MPPTEPPRVEFVRDEAWFDGMRDDVLDALSLGLDDTALKRFLRAYRVKVRKPKVCGECGGEKGHMGGAKADSLREDEWKPCPACHGSGYEPCSICDGAKVLCDDHVMCNAQGEGHVGENVSVCQKCHGTGHALEQVEEAIEGVYTSSGRQIPLEETDAQGHGAGVG